VQRTVRALIGRSFLRSGQGQDAYAIFDSLVASHPKEDAYLYGRGRAQTLLGRLDAAMEDFERVRRMDPTAFWVHTGIAQVMRTRGEFAKALEEIDKGLTMRPDDPTGLTEKGEIMLRLGRSQEALKLVKDALAHDAFSPGAHFLLGRLSFSQYNFKGALEAMTEATRRAPTFMDARLGLAEVFLLSGRPAEAEANLRLALSLGPVPPRLEGQVARLRGAFKEVLDAVN
jgi:tetratricopeptide (TPR) repeat protein